MKFLFFSLLAARILADTIPGPPSGENILVITGGNSVAGAQQVLTNVAWQNSCSAFLDGTGRLAELYAHTVTVGGVPGSCGAMAAYTQIWDLRFDQTTCTVDPCTASLTAAQIANYQCYIAGGGSVYLLADNSGFPGRNNGVVALVQSVDLANTFGNGGIGYNGGTQGTRLNAAGALAAEGFATDYRNLAGISPNGQVWTEFNGYVTDWGAGYKVYEDPDTGNAVGIAFKCQNMKPAYQAGKLFVMFDWQIHRDHYCSATYANDAFYENALDYLSGGNSCASPTFTRTATRTRTRTPTPTVTPSATYTQLTPSFTRTASRTLTLSLTATRTVTPSVSFTPTPTRTVTPSVSFTPTPTRTVTPSVTFTLTPTRTSTSTISFTPTLTPTRTHTRTASPSFTVSHTITPGPSPTFTATLTATRTHSPSATVSLTSTYSSTRSSTPSATPTSTISFTATYSATRTHTRTVTPSFTDSSTITPGPSPTFTRTYTATASHTPTFTESMTRTGSPTATPSRTATPTFTVTSTITETNLNTPSNTPTATPTSTATPTRTDTRTFTATATVTHSSTATPSSTESRTPSHTPSLTPSSTTTPTYSSTLTLTATPSQTPTSTSSVSFTHTPTITATPSLSPTPVPQPFQLKVELFNAAGEKVKSLFQGGAAQLPNQVDVDRPAFAAGQAGASLLTDLGGSYLWMGDNDNGQLVSSGVYYFKLETVDPFGKSTTLIVPVQVLEAGPQQWLAIYSGAGELVREISLPAGMVATDLALETQDSGSVKLGVRQGGQAPVWIAWDGLSSRGLPAQSGSYQALLLSKNGMGQSTVSSRAFQYLKAPGADPLEGLRLGPSPLLASQKLLSIEAPAFAGALYAEIFSLDGARVAQGGAPAGTLRLELPACAAGVYFARVQARAGSGLLASKTLKFSVLR